MDAGMGDDRADAPLLGAADLLLGAKWEASLAWSLPDHPGGPGEAGATTDFGRHQAALRLPASEITVRIFPRSVRAIESTNDTSIVVSSPNWAAKLLASRP